MHKINNKYSIKITPRKKERIKQNTNDQLNQRYRHTISSLGSYAKHTAQKVMHVPLSNEEKQRMFKYKCMQILSKRKQNNGQQNVMKMMDNMISHFRSKKKPQDIKSDYRKRYSVESNRVTITKMTQSVDLNHIIHEWRQKPDLTSARMNKILLQGQLQQANSLKCESMALGTLNFQTIQVLDQQQRQDKQQNYFPEKSNRRSTKLSQSTLKRVTYSTKIYNKQYLNQLRNQLEFVFKVNFSNQIYVNLQLEQYNQGKKYKVYVTGKNYTKIIRQLLAKRFWIQIVDQLQSDYAFYWDDESMKAVHQSQEPCGQKHFLTQRKCCKSTIRTNQTLNAKILSQKDAKDVETYFKSEGFIVPHTESFVCKTLSNHIPQNYIINCKKNLFKTLYQYYSNVKHENPYNYIPQTYHVVNQEDEGYKSFVNYNSHQPNRLWILKPGEHTNQGKDIQVIPYKQIKQYMRKHRNHANGQAYTTIIQSYMLSPFLYNYRKFDIRHFILITSVNGIVKCYNYKEGYLRTSSQIYNINDWSNEFIHLTNDSIQKDGDRYERYQLGNKISYAQFQRYLDYVHGSRAYRFDQLVLKPIRAIIIDLMFSCYRSIDPQRKNCNFQIFGLDFIIDQKLKPYLIEVNSNPSLKMNCPLLRKIIPTLIENTLRLTLDALLPPKCHYPPSKRPQLCSRHLQSLRYQLVFDEAQLTNVSNKAQPFMANKFTKNEVTAQ